MTLPSSVLELETSDFANKANFASDLRTFRKILVQDEAYQSLLTFLASSGGQVAIAERALSLVRVEVDERFEHPQDVAIATYLNALIEIGSAWSPIIAKSISQEHNAYWGAALVSEHGLSRQEHRILFPELEFETQDFSFNLPYADASYDLVIGAEAVGHRYVIEFKSSADVRRSFAYEPALFEPDPVIVDSSLDAEDLAVAVAL